MEEGKQKEVKGLSRRQMLKGSGLALGGLAIGGWIVPETRKALACDCDNIPVPTLTWTTPYNFSETKGFDPKLPSQRYSYFDSLLKNYPFNPYDKEGNSQTTIAPLDPEEMRITFMGSTVPTPTGHRAQQTMSIFVEVGWDEATQMPVDQFIFDMGNGVCTNYAAMNVGLGRMDKVFINHLHGDHMSDVLFNYCFGPSADRKSPLYVWGQSPSGVKSPRPPRRYYDDGVKAYCQNLREACRWHTESFSFQTTSYSLYPSQAEIQSEWGLPCKPVPVGDDPWGDAYALVPIELDWTKVGGVAYQNEKTGVRITHFPVVHCRKGSMGYKLEWWPNGEDFGNPASAISMVYTSDTKAEYNCISQATGAVDPSTGKPMGVDVFIHEMAVPPDVWAMKFLDISKDGGNVETPPGSNTPVVVSATQVQNSSHTPPGPFGYILTQIPRPRLTVATHFPTADDTVDCAKKIIKEDYFPTSTVYQGNEVPAGAVDPLRITWSFDLMVLSVTKEKILEKAGVVSDFFMTATAIFPHGPDGGAKSWGNQNPPKYCYPDGTPDPYAQIDTSMTIPSCEDGVCNYREDGY